MTELNAGIDLDNLLAEFEKIKASDLDHGLQSAAILSTTIKVFVDLVAAHEQMFSQLGVALEYLNLRITAMENR